MAEDTTPSTALVPSGGSDRFSVGDAVRVRAGVIDPDFPDIPISGWAGVVAERDGRSDPPLYLVRWTRETLSRVVPAYRSRCERAGLDPEQTSLLGADLEPDTGGPLTILPPTKLRPPPLNRDDPPDRVRAIFKLTSDDPLPPVGEASLRRFHEHFKKKLKLPVAAFCDGAPRPQEPASIVRLVPFEDTGTEMGLLVEVEQDDKIATGPLYDVKLLSRNAASRDVDAYGGWFLEEAGEEEAEGDSLESRIVFVREPRPNLRGEQEDFSDNASPFAEMRAYTPFIVRVVLACVLVGALAGALFWVHEWAMVMAEGGAAVVGGGVGFLIARLLFVRRNERKGLLTGIGAAGLAALMGAVVGAPVGVVLLAYVGAIPGALAGTVFGTVLTACGVRNHNTPLLALLGGYIGAVVYVLQLDAGGAIAGALRGAAAGLGTCVFCFAGSALLLVRVEGMQGPD